MSEQLDKDATVKIGDVKQAIVEEGVRIFGKEKVLAVVLFVLGCASSLGGWAALAQSTQAQVDAGIVPLTQATQAQAEELKRTKADVAELKAGVAQLQRGVVEKEQRDAQRFDTLYRTILSGRPQPEAAALAQPSTVPDGGI